MNISIFGLGYVGSVSAVCLAQQGYKVIGVDPNQMKVDMINAGQAVIVEPDLSALTAKVVANGNLRATQDIVDAAMNSSLSFVCIGTPSKKDNGLDLQYIERFCEDMGHVLKEKNDYHILVFRSTMLPGSIRNVVIPILEKYSGKKEGDTFSVCINPEFMKEGTAIHDFHYPPLSVVGTSDPRVRYQSSRINAVCTNMSTIFLDIEEAELLKYINNIWHALKVGFGNEIGTVCKSLNIDSHLVMDVFCQDTKLNISPHYWFCLT